MILFLYHFLKHEIVGLHFYIQWKYQLYYKIVQNSEKI